MADFIDRKFLLNYMLEDGTYTDKVRRTVMSVPAIQVESVKPFYQPGVVYKPEIKSYWIINSAPENGADPYAKCNNCGDVEIFVGGLPSDDEILNKLTYCPHCGARMKDYD